MRADRPSQVVELEGIRRDVRLDFAAGLGCSRLGPDKFDLEWASIRSDDLLPGCTRRLVDEPSEDFERTVGQRYDDSPSEPPQSLLQGVRD